MTRKSNLIQVTAVPAGLYGVHFKSIHFDVLVAAKTWNKIKLTKAHAQDRQQECYRSSPARRSMWRSSRCLMRKMFLSKQRQRWNKKRRQIMSHQLMPCWNIHSLFTAPANRAWSRSFCGRRSQPNTKNPANNHHKIQFVKMKQRMIRTFKCAWISQTTTLAPACSHSCLTQLVITLYIYPLMYTHTHHDSVKTMQVWSNSHGKKPAVVGRRTLQKTDWTHPLLGHKTNIPRIPL